LEKIRFVPVLRALTSACLAAERRGRSLKNDFAAGYVHHAHLLARGVGHAFDGHSDSQRAIGIQVIGLWRQQIADGRIHALDSVLGTMGWLHDEDLAVVTWRMKAAGRYCAEINAAILRLRRWRCDDSTRSKTLMR
jgi:hypothetical protein